MAVAKCEAPRSEEGQAAHSLRAGYMEDAWDVWGDCGGRPRAPCTLLSLPRPATQGMRPKDPWTIARVSLRMCPNSGLFSACFPAGKGARCQAQGGYLGPAGAR